MSHFQNMHICFICNEYPTVSATYGGVGTFTRTLARALVRRGHRATIVGAYETAGVSNDEGISVVRVAYSQRGGSGVLTTAYRMRKTLQRLHAADPIDIIDSAELGLAGLIGRLWPVRIIRMNGGHHFFAHTLGRKPLLFRGGLERLSFANADVLCAVSHYIAQTTRGLLNLGQRSIAILPNSVDTDRFAPRADITPITGRIVFVGTLCEKKGIHQLVQAMPKIMRSMPNAQLVAVGRDWRDPATGTSYLKGLLGEIEPVLRNNIDFCGPVPNEQLPEILATADVCVFPSHMEAQGIVVCEAMASGRPVVASNTGPGSEIIEHGISGLLCNPHNPDDIAEQIITVLSDKVLASRICAAGRHRAEERFSIDVLVERNESFYIRCLSELARV